MPAFVSGYMMIMDKQKLEIKTVMSTHLAELMADAELYDWEATRAFHTVWLQQLEQGRVTWKDTELRASHHGTDRPRGASRHRGSSRNSKYHL